MDECEFDLDDTPPLVISLFGSVSGYLGMMAVGLSGLMATKPSVLGVCRVDLVAGMLRVPPFDPDFIPAPKWHTLQKRSASGLVPTSSSILVAIDVLAVQLATPPTSAEEAIAAAASKPTDGQDAVPSSPVVPLIPGFGRLRSRADPAPPSPTPRLAEQQTSAAVAGAARGTSTNTATVRLPPLPSLEPHGLQKVVVQIVAIGVRGIHIHGRLRHAPRKPHLSFDVGDSSLGGSRRTSASSSPSPRDPNYNVQLFLEVT